MQPYHYSLPDTYWRSVVCNGDGTDQIEPLKKAARGQDVHGSIAVLRWRAENENTINVAEADDITQDEVFAHARFILLCRAGKAASACKSVPVVQTVIERAEREAQSP